MKIEMDYKTLKGFITTEGNAHFLLYPIEGSPIIVNITMEKRKQLFEEVKDFCKQKL